MLILVSIHARGIFHYIVFPFQHVLLAWFPGVVGFIYYAAFSNFTATYAEVDIVKYFSEKVDIASSFFFVLVNIAVICLCRG